MASGILVARELGASAKGTLTYGLTAFALLVPMLSMGVGLATVYLIATKTYKTQHVLFTTILLATTIGILAASVFWWLFSKQLLGESGADLTAECIIPLIVAAPAFALTPLSSRILHGQDDFTLYNKINVACACLESSSLILFVVILEFGIVAAFAVVAIRQVVQSTVQIIAIYGTHGCTWSVNFKFLRSVFAYGLKAWPENIANRANARIDQLIIGLFIGSAELGNYSVAVSVADLTNTIRVSVGNPILTRLSKERSSANRLQLASKASRFIFALVIGQAVLLAIAGWFAIPLVYSNEFLSSRWLLLLYLPGVVVLGPRSVIAKLFQAANKVEFNTFTQVIAFIISPVIYLTMIPAFGVYGIAIGSTAIYFITTLIAFIFMKQTYPQFDLFNFVKIDSTEISQFLREKICLRKA